MDVVHKPKFERETHDEDAEMKGGKERMEGNAGMGQGQDRGGFRGSGGDLYRHVLLEQVGLKQVRRRRGAGDGFTASRSEEGIRYMTNVTEKIRLEIKS